MARVIKEHIKKPLAEELLFGALEGGGHVRIGVKDGELSFAFQGKEEVVVH
jgi:ATP-dependent Clp protease ATP-binding subunit ClpA